MGSRTRVLSRAILRSLSQYKSSGAAVSSGNALGGELSHSGRDGGAVILKETLAWKRETWISIGLFAATGAAVGVGCASAEGEEDQGGGAAEEGSKQVSKPRVVFVLGGPGSGKGTQCAKIVDQYGFVHLSAGDLLRAEVQSGSPDGTMIQNMIKEGKIVPSAVTINLLNKAMAASNNDKFLIDGFPRNEENRADFEKITGITPEFILFFDCPEAVLESRLLGRNEGRVDDNITTIRKRFKVFVDSSLPVIDYYERSGKVRKVDATKSREEVFSSIEPLFRPFVADDLKKATESLLTGIDSRDYAAYEKYCDPALTAFEPEAAGHLVTGLDFHKFYLGGTPSGAPSRQSTVSAPVVTLLDGNVGLVTYTRLVQDASTSEVKAFNETRVWHRKTVNGRPQWKNVHFHRSSA